MPVGVSPKGIVVTPDGKKVYVANYGSNTTSVIDTSTNKVTATVPVGHGPYGVSAIGTKVYVANRNSNTVSVIDTATNHVTATVPVGNHPKAFGQFIGGNMGLEQNNNSTAVSSGTGSTKMTGFEMVFGIVGLFAVFLHKRK